jgi:hypothetical protein
MPEAKEKKAAQGSNAKAGTRQSLASKIQSRRAQTKKKK